MENELTFVAPEGVYSVTEEHKPTISNPHIVNATTALYPTRLSTVAVRFLQSRQANAPGLSQLLGGSKEARTRDKQQDKDKDKEKDDGKSVSSSDKTGGDDEEIASPDAINSPLLSTSPPVPSYDPPSLFSPPVSPAGKKKSVSRPKRNIRTTSSTFVTRLQSADNLTKTLQSKQGETTFLFYNSAKNFFWTEVGTQAKVIYCFVAIH